LLAIATRTTLVGQRAPKSLHCTARTRRASKSSPDPYSAGYITCTIVPHNMTDHIFAPYNGQTHLVAL
jgi:hypothetical protein